MMASIKMDLYKNGRICLIEHRTEDQSMLIKEFSKKILLAVSFVILKGYAY